MRVNRGCGCFLLILAIANAVFAIAGVIGLALGNVTVWLGLLALVLFGANAAATLMLGWAGLRGRAVGGAGPAYEGDGGETTGGQPEDDSDIGEGED